LRTAQIPKAIQARARKTNKRVIVAVLLLLTLILAGCGRQIPPYWPDLAVDTGAGDEGLVYVVAGQVFALQADSGTVMWTYPVVSQQRGGLLSGCSGPIASDGPFYAAPAFDRDLVFLGSAGEEQRSLLGRGENRAGLRALNKAGILQWDFRQVTDNAVAPPAVSGTTVYLASSDHNVYAIDIESRQVKWALETGNWVWATPLVVEDRVYIASMDHVLYAVDSQDGNQVWRFDESAGALPAAPAIADGVLYFGSLDGYVYAVQAETGTLLWKHKVDGGVWATPLVYDHPDQNTPTLSFGTLGGQVYALNAQDGSTLWEQSVGGEVRGAPAYANSRLYFGCEDGQLYVFDAYQGTPQLSPLGQQLENASIYTSPVFDGQRLYVVATDGQVFALDPVENTVLWKTNPLEKKE
jgi:outer membrane protein assembly factor BamB